VGCLPHFLAINKQAENLTACSKRPTNDPMHKLFTSAWLLNLRLATSTGWFSTSRRQRFQVLNNVDQWLLQGVGVGSAGDDCGVQLEMISHCMVSLGAAVARRWCWFGEDGRSVGLSNDPFDETMRRQRIWSVAWRISRCRERGLLTARFCLWGERKSIVLLGDCHLFHVANLRSEPTWFPRSLCCWLTFSPVNCLARLGSVGLKLDDLTPR
jgi:hypothetical protein